MPDLHGDRSAGQELWCVFRWCNSDEACASKAKSEAFGSRRSSVDAFCLGVGSSSAATRSTNTLQRIEETVPQQVG